MKPLFDTRPDAVKTVEPTPARDVAPANRVDASRLAYIAFAVIIAVLIVTNFDSIGASLGGAARTAGNLVAWAVVGIVVLGIARIFWPIIRIGLHFIGGLIILATIAYLTLS